MRRVLKKTRRFYAPQALTKVSVAPPIKIDGLDGGYANGASERRVGTAARGADAGGVFAAVLLRTLLFIQK